MLMMIWHWITGEIFGWGGVGALVSAGAWALWFFCPTVPGVGTVLPYKSQLLHIAIAATVFTVTQMYFFTDGYKKGEADCKSRWDAANVQAAIDAQNRDKSVAAKAAEAAKAANDTLKDQSDALQKQVDDYAEQLKSRKGGDCPLSDDDVMRLRSIK